LLFIDSKMSMDALEEIRNEIARVAAVKWSAASPSTPTPLPLPFDSMISSALPSSIMSSRSSSGTPSGSVDSVPEPLSVEEEKRRAITDKDDDETRRELHALQGNHLIPLFI
jgi:cobalamin biosynthesis Mg chelatase CobN